MTLRVKIFTIQNESPERFFRKMERTLRKGDLGKFATVELSLPLVKIRFDKLGITEFDYEIQADENNFKASQTREKVALTHTFFRAEVEQELTRIIQGFGGIVEP